MATVAFSPPGSRGTEIALAAFGLAFAFALAYICVDLLSDGAMTRGIGGLAGMAGEKIPAGLRVVRENDETGAA